MKPYVLLFTVVVFAVPTVITLKVAHAGQEGIEAKASLQSVMT